MILLVVTVFIFSIFILALIPTSSAFETVLDDYIQTADSYAFVSLPFVEKAHQ